MLLDSFLIRNSLSLKTKKPFIRRLLGFLYKNVSIYTKMGN